MLTLLKRLFAVRKTQPQPNEPQKLSRTALRAMARPAFCKAKRDRKRLRKEAKRISNTLC